MDYILSMNESNSFCDIFKYFGNVSGFDFFAFYFSIEITILEKLKNEQGGIIMLKIINNLYDVRMFKFS